MKFLRLSILIIVIRTYEACYSAISALMQLWYCLGPWGDVCWLLNYVNQ